MAGRRWCLTDWFKGVGVVCIWGSLAMGGGGRRKGVVGVGGIGELMVVSCRTIELWKRYIGCQESRETPIIQVLRSWTVRCRWRFQLSYAAIHPSKVSKYQKACDRRFVTSFTSCIAHIK